MSLPVANDPHEPQPVCRLTSPLALALGAFFGINVLTPLWLQYNMGYNTTLAGLVVAWGGLLSVAFSPISVKSDNSNWA